MNRCILHIDVPAFPVQMELTRYHHLRGKPVAIVPDFGPRATICSVSHRAKVKGVDVGMLLSHANKRCPELHVLPFDRHFYRSFDEVLLDVMRETSPSFESGGLGCAYADISYAARNQRFLRELAQQSLLKTQQALGARASAGIARNKLVSRIAAQTTSPGKMRFIESGHERDFLDPLPPRYLPAVDRDIRRQLDLMGIKSIESLALLSRSDLTILFGQSGRRLYDEANGIDESPLSSWQRSGEVFSEILVPDSNNHQVLCNTVYRLAEMAANKLRTSQRGATLLSFEVEHADERTVTTWLKLSRPSSSDRELKCAAATLLDKTIKRRVAVRSMALSLVTTIPTAQQLHLFQQPRFDTEQKLESTLDRIKSTFGEKAIGYAKVA